MTLREMLDDLDLPLNLMNQAKPKPFDFTPAIRVRLLNRGQRKAISEIFPIHTRQLEIWALAQSLDSEGGFDWSNLSPFEGEKGIIAVKHTGGYYCDPISQTRNRQYDDAGIIHDETQPKMFFLGTNVYVRPYAGKTIDVLHRDSPTDMALGATESLDTNCVFGEQVQEIILEYATAFGFRYGGALKRALDFRISAQEMINELNGGYAIVDTVSLEVTTLLGQVADTSISSSTRSAMSGSILTTTITAGVITLTGSGTYIINAETGVTDDLTKITGLIPGNRVILSPADGHTITVKHGTYLHLGSGRDFVMNTKYDNITLTCIDVTDICREDGRSSVE